MASKANKSVSWQHLYRCLLRSSAAAVRFSRPAARNTRRYLRDEFAAALGSDATQSTASKGKQKQKSTLKASVRELLETRTRNTVALHLSSSLYPSASAPSEGSGTQDDPPSSTALTRTPDHDDNAGTSSKPTSSGRLAHRLVSNLSSLTYHHLSPHTQMQSFAHKRTLRKPKKLSSLARLLSSHTPFEEEGEVVMNEAHMKLTFLQPTGKPVRGPISARLKEWDGQAPEKVVSVGMIRQMEADLATVETMLEGEKVESRQVKELREEAGELKKKIMVKNRMLKIAEERRRIKDIPLGHLADLVSAAQDEEGLLLAKERWNKRKAGEFLPP